jgi:translation initiation factor IF-2
VYVSWNHGDHQRLDAETLTIADEFGYEVEFITVDIEDSIAVVEDRKKI